MVEVTSSEESGRPFFSIGVTTYNRRELLKQTLTSLISQSFTDFEVIVGNDYTAEVLTSRDFDIEDNRIRFINHPQNLRETANMNALLSMSNGRYFTWLADDDVYLPNFLQSVYDTIKRFNSPSSVFTSYKIILGTDFPVMTPELSSEYQLLTGREFLQKYFKGMLKIIATCGVFKKEELARIGGIEELCTSAVGLYGEYAFLLKCGYLKNIAYINAPLVLYRSHPGCWSGENIEIEKYQLAGKELILRGAGVFNDPGLKPDIYDNLFALCQKHLRSYYGKIAMSYAGLGFNIRDIIKAIKVADIEEKVIRNIFIDSIGGNAGKIRTSFNFFFLKNKNRLVIIRILILSWLGLRRYGKG